MQRCIIYNQSDTLLDSGSDTIDLKLIGHDLRASMVFQTKTDSHPENAALRLRSLDGSMLRKGMNFTNVITSKFNLPLQIGIPSYHMNHQLLGIPLFSPSMFKPNSCNSSKTTWKKSSRDPIKMRVAPATALPQ